MSSHESSGSVETVTGGHADPIELAERIEDPSQHALVAGHVHARMDLG
jgi:hypothetical protein